MSAPREDDAEWFDSRHWDRARDLNPHGIGVGYIAADAVRRLGEIPLAEAMRKAGAHLGNGLASVMPGAEEVRRLAEACAAAYGLSSSTAFEDAVTAVMIGERELIYGAPLADRLEVLTTPRGPSWIKQRAGARTPGKGRAPRSASSPPALRYGDARAKR